MAGFADQVHIDVIGFTKRVIHSELKLEQKMLAQHEFSFMWHYTGSTVIKPTEQFKQISGFAGNEVIFTFRSEGGTKLMAKGIIQETESYYHNGSPVGLLVRGRSHCIHLNDIKKSRYFKNKTLDEIALEIFQNEGPGECYQREAIKSTFTKRFDAIAQYKETSFDFLKRTAIRYGQWFYFDGMRIQLGQLKYSKIKLQNGSSLHNFNTKTFLKSQKTSLTGYDSNNAQTINSSLDKTATGSDNSLSRHANKFQRQVAISTDLGFGSYTTQANTSAEIEEMVKLQAAANDANSLFYTGTSYLPIGLGQVFEINDQGTSINVIAIKSTHLSTGRGNYKCDFVAIPAEVTAPHYTNVAICTEAKSQPAKITENNDPERLGRVKVSFNWFGGLQTTESDWMRVGTTYASGNYGSYEIPEKGDEVMVMFEGDDIDRPFVSHSLYNGQARPEYFHENNDFKVKKTREGHRLLFEELKNIELADHRGNIFHIDSVGDTINITALQTINLKAKNINIIAEENITSTAGMNISESATINKNTTVGGNMFTGVTGNNMLKVTGDHDEFVDGDYQSKVKKERQVATESKIITQSDKGHEFHTDKEIKNNSGEGTRMN